MKLREYKATKMIVVLICIGLLFINPLKKDIWDSNLKLLKNEILSIDMVGKKVNLSTFTPFEWDTVYSFSPYTPKEMIYEIIGYKWDRISETVSEGMNQIVFVKDGKVVCYIYGYPQNNKYGVFFDGSDHQRNAAILYSKDNPIFNITKNEDVVYLTHNK